MNDGAKAKLSGTGWVPGEMIERVVRLRNPNDCIDMIFVKHVSGKPSVICFKAYSQGYRVFGGTRQHIIVYDEDPAKFDNRIYEEGKKRTTTTDGIILMPMTPTAGMTDAVVKFYPDPQKNNRVLVQATIWDADDWVIPKHRKQQIWDEADEFERPCRCLGEPFQGSGKIFCIPKNNYMIDDVRLDPSWHYGIGLDFGSVNFGACFAAHDWKNDVFYVFGEYEQKGAETIQTKAFALKDKMRHYSKLIGFGGQEAENWICAWGWDGTITQEEDCETTSDQWRKYGMKLMEDYCHILETKVDDKGKTRFVKNRARGPQIDIMRQGLDTGKIKITRDCFTLLRQIDFYHKENGKIVKLRDHVLDSSRHLYIMKEQMKRLDFSAILNNTLQEDTNFDPIESVMVE